MKIGISVASPTSNPFLFEIKNNNLQKLEYHDSMKVVTVIGDNAFVKGQGDDHYDHALANQSILLAI